MPTRKLSVIGLNHQTAPVAVREVFTLGPDLSRRLLKRIHGEDAFEEVLVLDTCNRTEVYYVAADANNPLAYLLDHIGRLKGTAPSADPALFYRHDGLAAVEHLFRVAASLDSQIVGEHQILGQVKAAYRLAVEAHSVRFLLNKLLHWAFRVGKRVQTETDLGRGSAGIAQAAVELARRHLGRLEEKSVLLVGAGRNAELAARILLRAGAGRLVVANRTVERARRLAEDLMRPPKGKEIPPDETDDAACPALPRQATSKTASEDVGGAGEPLRPEAVGLEEIPRLIGSMDLVLASTASPGIVLDYETLAEPIAAAGRPLVILDIAMPRDADPRLGRLPNVRRCNLDDLERLVEANLNRRRAEIPRAETIVAEEVRAFDKWAGSLQVAPTIRLLQKRLEQIQKDLVGQHGSRFSDADRPQLEQFTQSLCGRLLHDPLTFLRGLSEEAPLSETLATVEIIRRMFDLDALEQDE